MKNSVTLARLLFTCLSLLFFTIAISAVSGEMTKSNITLGLLCGSTVAGFLILLDAFYKNVHLRAINTLTIGLFVGLALFSALYLAFQTIIEAIIPLVSFTSIGLLTSYAIGKVFLLLLGLYIGVIFTFRCCHTLRESLPVIKVKQEKEHVKKIIFTHSVLSDSRIVELSRCGLLDQRILIPRFVVNDLYTQCDAVDEPVKVKARRSLENLRQLEEIEALEMEYTDLDYPEIKQPSGKIVKLALEIKANILTADSTNFEDKMRQPSLRVMNLNDISHHLKPLMEAGEIMEIKVQRYGKEARQGIGYLDDGTMVVINGGGDFIGESIQTQVLSVKHTSSGRIIFCNSIDNEFQTVHSHQSELIEA